VVALLRVITVLVSVPLVFVVVRVEVVRAYTVGVCPFLTMMSSGIMSRANSEQGVPASP
jgi:hypothetical protein